MIPTRRPIVGEIVIAPLVHPNGIYIRDSANARIPVLAKVRLVFADTANVINFFGYTYNVPNKHVQPCNPIMSNMFYVNIISNASAIMARLGYQAQNNAEFYTTLYNPSTYGFLAYLPNYQNPLVASPLATRPLVSSPLVTSPLATRPLVTSPLMSSEPTIHSTDCAGSIECVVFGESSILHMIRKTSSDILYDSGTGLLRVRGYGAYVVDRVHEYADPRSYVKYMVFKSYRNYVCARKEHIRIAPILEPPVHCARYYRVSGIGVNPSDPAHRFYVDLIQMIGREHGRPVVGKSVK